MQYGGLAARDSTGRALPAEMALSGNGSPGRSIDRDAVYPVTIDPYIATQAAILNATDKAASAYFGYSVSVYNSTAVVGAWEANAGATGYAGQAYVFQNSGGSNWNQIAILNASDKSQNAYLGYAVSVYNDTIVVGAYNANPGSVSGAGEAYVFQNTGGNT